MDHHRERGVGKSVDLRQKFDKLAAAHVGGGSFDATLPVEPARAPGVGAMHPLTLVSRHIEDVFRAMGFYVALTRTVEFPNTAGAPSNICLAAENLHACAA